MQKEEYVTENDIKCIDRYEELHHNYYDITEMTEIEQERQVRIDETGREFAEILQGLRKANQDLELKETEIDELKSEIANYREVIREMEDAFFWRIIKPARIMLDRVKGKVNDE